MAVDGDAPAAAVAATAPENQEPRATDARPGGDPLAVTAPNLQMPPTGMEATLRPEAAVPAEAPAPEDARGMAATIAGAEPPVENLLRANVVAPPVAPVDVTGAKRQSVSAVTGRDIADERVRPRAEKLRRASSIVLDEAAADPSLRFVLVAVGLIIISILLLLLARIL